MAKQLLKGKSFISSFSNGAGWFGDYVVWEFGLSATRHADVPWWNQFEKLDSTWVWVTCLLCHLRIFPSCFHRSLPTSTMASLKLLKLSFNELMTRREIISITSRDKIKKVGENFHQFSLLVSWNFIRSSCFYFAIFKAINVFKDCFPYFSHACTMRDEIREKLYELLPSLLCLFWRKQFFIHILREFPRQLF